MMYLKISGLVEEINQNYAWLYSDFYSWEKEQERKKHHMMVGVKERRVKGEDSSALFIIVLPDKIYQSNSPFSDNRKGPS